MSSSIAASVVDHEIWCAVVGPSVKIPAVNSYVYYFPQGHLENSSNVVSYDTVNTSIPCRVISHQFLSSSSSDESSVKVLLQPVHPAELIRAGERENNDDQIIDVDSFSKVLTPSDANNGGGFSVPKYCADSIFPNLDLSDDPPVQNLTIRDTHGNAWEFRHIYRGTPRRHLLTTGWSKFVNSKRLVAGDSVVFMKRRSTGGLFFGIRRNARIGAGDERGRVEAVMAAVENAAKGLVFEVDYYPRDGSRDFVVSAARVVAAMRVQWCEGMRVKMAVETDDPARTTWYEGMITAANSQSPWRMLKVTWEEPGLQPNMDKVSPWEVELEPPMLSPSHLSLAFPPYKKLKLSHDGDQGEFSFPLAEPAASFPYAPFPIAECDDSPHRSFTELLKRGMEKEPETVSTVLTIGSPNSDRSSNVQQGQNPSTVEGRRSILLFGRTIRTGEISPTEGGGSRNGGGF